ncbi:MAG TPA: DMT family transporter [Anaerolineales bacterium]|nr:DMT family transporter [Anaerolineales bacterium]
MQNAALYALTTLIWGSTWLAITFQLGVVAPEASVVYRFGLASLILMAYAGLRRLPMRYRLRDHVFIALQGIFLFCLNYITVYLAEQRLASGLVAIVFATLTLCNVVLAAVFLRNAIKPRVVLGGLLGLVGLTLVFWRELAGLSFAGEWRLGLGLSLAAVLSASIGNIVAARNQRAGLPVVQTNAYGMAYGALATFGIALVRGVPFAFDPSPGYIASLLYLAIFGSVVAFGAYLTLVGRIGVARAGYVAVIFPLVALGLSWLFEGLQLNLQVLLGVLLVAGGNVLVLSRRSAAAPDSH